MGLVLKLNVKTILLQEHIGENFCDFVSEIVLRYDTRRGFLADSVVKKNLPANAGDMNLIPGLGRSSTEGNGSPLQYSWLDNLWTEEPSRFGSQRVWHDLVTKQRQQWH